jgi:hypothetical protein
VSALLTWAGAICGGWLLIGAVIMLVGIRNAPRRDDWD